MNATFRLGLIAMVAAASFATQAAVVTIPASSLVPSTTLYTTDLGISIGNPLTMTGGGNAANVGGQRNDDGFSGPISFGFNFTLFGATYTSFYANNNGSISFNAGIPAFTPEGLQGSAQPIISPFFGDVDTRAAASGLMSLQRHSSAAGDEVIVTWPNVGFYSAQDNHLNTFQLVVRSDDYVIPTGEGQVGFFYNQMAWEVGQASGGNSDGLCPPGPSGLGTGCVPAAIGFGDGQSNGYVLEGSTMNGIAAEVNNTRLWVSLAAGVPVVPGGTVPEPGTLLLTAAAMMGLAMARRSRVRRS